MIYAECVIQSYRSSASLCFPNVMTNWLSTFQSNFAEYRRCLGHRGYIQTKDPSISSTTNDIDIASQIAKIDFFDRIKYCESVWLNYLVCIAIIWFVMVYRDDRIIVGWFGDLDVVQWFLFSLWIILVIVDVEDTTVPIPIVLIECVFC